MKIQSINNTSFGMTFKISGKTLDAISNSTGLSKDELFGLTLSDASKLMKERGLLKEPSKLRQWFSDMYKKFGEKMGLLQKEYHIYSDGD